MNGNNSRVKSFYIASIEFLWGSLTVHHDRFRQDMSSIKRLPIISFLVLNDLTKIYKKIVPAKWRRCSDTDSNI